MKPSLGGQLLVASPSLDDPNFLRSVVLLLAHSDEGALGIVLNRPLGAAVHEFLPLWQYLAVPPAEVFRGGPVAVNSAVCLGRVRPGVDVEAIDGLEATVDGLVSVDLNRDPEHFGDALTGIRVFSGYAGWSAGQLEGELELGGWILAPALPHDPLTTDPDGLWAAVLRHQGGLRAAYATAPPKLSLN
jgi:putative transcriptional regulator